MFQLRSAPLERIIDAEGDGLKSLRLLRDKYLDKGYFGAAANVDTLIGSPAVADEPILTDGESDAS